MRAGLADLVTREMITAGDAAAILEQLMGMWFGERSLALFRDLILERQPTRADELRTWFQRFDQFRIKARDLVSFLDQRPWLERSPKREEETAP